MPGVQETHPRFPGMVFIPTCEVWGLSPNRSSHPRGPIAPHSRACPCARLGGDLYEEAAWL